MINDTFQDCDGCNPEMVDSCTKKGNKIEKGEWFERSNGAVTFTAVQPIGTRSGHAITSNNGRKTGEDWPERNLKSNFANQNHVHRYPDAKSIWSNSNKMSVGVVIKLSPFETTDTSDQGMVCLNRGGKTDISVYYIKFYDYFSNEAIELVTTGGKM